MRGARLSRKFFQMPSVYDVAVENQAVAIDVAQEMADFFCFGMRGTQMNARACGNAFFVPCASVF